MGAGFCQVTSRATPLTVDRLWAVFDIRLRGKRTTIAISFFSNECCSRCTNILSEFFAQWMLWVVWSHIINLSVAAKRQRRLLLAGHSHVTRALAEGGKQSRQNAVINVCTSPFPGDNLPFPIYWLVERGGVQASWAAERCMHVELAVAVVLWWYSRATAMLTVNCPSLTTPSTNIHIYPHTVDRTWLQLFELILVCVFIHDCVYFSILILSSCQHNANHFMTD